MDYVKAKEHYRKKVYGRCTTCAYSEIPKMTSTKLFFCNIREQSMNNELLFDYFTIKFCKYYEKGNK